MFLTESGLSATETDTRGLIAWGTAPYDTLDSTPFNQMERDLLSAGGAGMVPGVLSGGVCTASGLTVSIPAGTSILVKQVWTATGTTAINVTASATSYIWLCGDGELRATASITIFPTGFDVTSAALLCKATAGASAVTIDNTVQHKARSVSGRVVSEGPVSLDYGTNLATFVGIVLPSLTADPAAPVNGQVWVRSDTSQLCVRIAGTIKRVTLT